MKYKAKYIQIACDGGASTGKSTAAKLISDIAPTYFVAISALVAAYFGANAYVDKKTEKKK